MIAPVMSSRSRTRSLLRAIFAAPREQPTLTRLIGKLPPRRVVLITGKPVTQSGVERYLCMNPTFVEKTMLVSSVRWRRPFVPTTLVLALVVGALSCDSTPNDPANELDVELEVAPLVVSPAEAMTVKLILRNPTSDLLALGSGDSCVALPEVWSGTTKLQWEGTGLGCLSVVSSFEIPADDSLLVEYELQALLQEDQAPWDYVIPPPPGTYRVVMDMHVDLPNIEREFEVVE